MVEEGFLAVVVFFVVVSFWAVVDFFDVVVGFLVVVAMELTSRVTFLLMHLQLCHSEGAKRPWESPGTMSVSAVFFDEWYRAIATSGLRPSSQ